MNEFLENIQFDRPWILLFVAAAGLLAFSLLLQKRRSLLVSSLRFVSLSLLLFALASPGRESSSSKSEIAAMVDISRSVSDRALEVFTQKLSSITASDTELELFAFGKKAGKRSERLRGQVSAATLRDFLMAERERLDSGETNLEAAMRTAQARTRSASLLLFSDGFETAGNARDAATPMGDAGIRIFPIVPSEDIFLDRGVSIASVYAPVTTAEGDAVDLRVTLNNSEHEDEEGKLEIFLEQERLFTQNVSVPKEQEKVFLARTAPLKGGLKRIRAIYTPGQSGKTNSTSERHRWISVKEKSKILLLSGSKEDSRILRELIRDRGYALQEIEADGNTEIPVTFESISTVVLNNVARQQLPKKFLPALEVFVKGGGGLLLVGGERSFGLGNYIDTQLEEMSPVKFVPPQTQQRRLTNAVALVVDKSGSMAYEGKMESAKRAAIASIDALKDEDYISVIGFDAVPFVIIDVKQVRDARIEAEHRLRNLTATGKTDLLPALAVARQRLQKAGTSRKHIIVLTDGKIPWSSDQYTQEVNALRRDGVSISTVAVGIEADIPFLKMLSSYGKGAFYQTMDASELPRIFVQDIKVTTGEKTMREGEEFPVGLGPSGLKSTLVESAFPTLRGFVETLPKKGSEVELLTKKEDRAFPMLASWMYGAGKVVAFTSDANGRWSQPWLRWPEFSRFWSRMIDGLRDKSGSKSASDIDFDIRYHLQGRTLIFDLSVFDDKLRTQLPPRIVGDVAEPGGETRQVSFRALKKGRFEARLEPARPGDYRIAMSYGNVKFPPVAITLEGELFGEAPGRGLNEGLLAELAYRTGGRINPRREEILKERRVFSEKTPLFPQALLLAALLILLEALIRERNWLRKRAEPAALLRFPKEVGQYSKKKQQSGGRRAKML